MAVAVDQTGQIVKIDQYANSIGKWLEGNQRKLEALLPRQIRADRFIRLVVGAIRRMPKLGLCSRESVVDAMLEAAALGLELDTALGHCYVLPYRNHGVYEATFILGYKGTVALMYRGGQVKSARAFEVFERDHFEIDDGAEHPVVHKRCLAGDRGKLLGFASLVHTANGGEIADYMSVDQVEAIRKRSRAGDSGPWVTDFGEMGKKTVLKRNGKYAPVSAEAARAMALDDAAENNLPQSFSLSIADDKSRALPDRQVEPMPAEVMEGEFHETIPVAAAKAAPAAEPAPTPAHVDPQPTIPPPTHTAPPAPAPVAPPPAPAAVAPPPASAPSPAPVGRKPDRDYVITVWGEGRGEVVYKGKCADAEEKMIGRYIHQEEAARDGGRWKEGYVEINGKRLGCAVEWRAYKQAQAAPAVDDDGRGPPPEDAPPVGAKGEPWDGVF
jgi:recombination protein RecT